MPIWYPFANHHNPSSSNPMSLPAGRAAATLPRETGPSLRRRLQEAPRLEALATALPPRVLEQATAKRHALRHFRRLPNLRRLLSLFDNDHIRTRHLVLSAEEILSGGSFAARNARYLEHALELAESASRAALAAAGVGPQEVDQIVLVSSTGIATPSLDAHLLNRLGLTPAIRRWPLWGLGCAGGAAGLALAADLARARPDSRVLLVAVEICSLTFQSRDISKRNLVATSLFADGAAAVLLAGPAARATEAGRSHAPRPTSTTLTRSWPSRGRPAAPPRVVASSSTTWSDSLEVMGWQLGEDGLEVVFSREIPAIVAQRMRGTVEAFLEELGLDRHRIRHWIAHPGGAKVLESYQRALELSPEDLRHSRRVLGRCGNISSPTVFFVLEECLRRGTVAAGDWGLLTALGPGFSANQSLLAW